MKTVKFYTLGCKVNQYETQIMREQFINAGFEELEDNLPSDIYVINTCTVTQQADNESLSLIRQVYRENPEAKIIVTGCLTELDSDKITGIPGVSLIVKNEDKSCIVSLLDNLRKTQDAGRRTQEGITYFKNHTRAFLKVQDGCNYCCSYCKVSRVRGESHSRPIDEIKTEARILARNGYLEIVLCGICLGSYGRDLVPKLNLVDVIAELEKIEGVQRIRLSSIEASDITGELIRKISQSSKLCPHLHIPMQSGDNQILKRMNRPCSREQYIELINRIRQDLPEVAITTDVLVGFPGETEENFQNTLGLICQIQPLRVHIFPYSRRLNTPAYSFKDQVPGNEIKKRTAVFKLMVEDSSFGYLQRFISRTCPVLIEGLVKKSRNLWEGYTDNYIKVRIESCLELKNKIILAKLKKIYPNYVLAELIRENSLQ